MSPRIAMKRIGDLFFDLLMRFEFMGADIALGIAGTFYGIGCMIDCATGDRCLALVGILSLVLGVQTQIAAYLHTILLRRATLVANVMLWAYKAADVSNSSPIRAQSLYLGLALVAIIASARAAASAQIEKLSASHASAATRERVDG